MSLQFRGKNTSFDGMRADLNIEWERGREGEYSNSIRCALSGREYLARNWTGDKENEIVQAGRVPQLYSVGIGQKARNAKKGSNGIYKAGSRLDSASLIPIRVLDFHRAQKRLRNTTIRVRSYSDTRCLIAIYILYIIYTSRFPRRSSRLFHCPK